MYAASRLLRDSRIAAGLTQAQLADRLGTSQPRIARLESPESNPTIETLERAIAATGHKLQMIAPNWGNNIDASLVREQLRRSPAERLATLDELTATMNMARRARRV